MTSAGTIPLSYNVILAHKNSKGELLDTREIKNTVVTVGKAAVAKKIAGVPQAEQGSFVFIAIGSGTTSAVAGDIALESEFTAATDAGARRAADASPTVTTTTLASDTAQIDVTFTFGATLSVTETGLFNGSPQGVGSMMARTTFSAVNVVSGDSLTVTWKIKAA